MKKVLWGAFLSLFAMGMAHASIIPTFVSMTNLGGGVFAYNYDVYVESPGERVQTTTTAGLGGVPPAGYDNHFTFFDFAGYVPGSATCSGSGKGAGSCGSFAVSVNNVGPPAFEQAPTDSSSLANVTWTATSGANITSGSYLGLFTLDSTSSNQGTITFAGQSTKDGGGQDGTVTGNIAHTVGPIGGTSAVPEPATLLLLGMGLIGLSLGQKRLTKR